MSKQDTHFFNVFTLLISILVTVTVLIFALARAVASHTQEAQVLEDPAYAADIASRIERSTREAVAGQNNAALAIKVETPAAAGAAAPAMPKDGEQLFRQVCSACHGAGIAGAPKAGDKAVWAPRIAEGMPTLYQHALNGYQGGPGGGVMPAKGGRPDLPDALVKQGVDYMVKMSK